jgi:hypothetical protein
MAIGSFQREFWKLSNATRPFLRLSLSWGPPLVGPIFYALSDGYTTESDEISYKTTQSVALNILSENLLKFPSGVPLFLVDHTRSSTCVFLTQQQSKPSPSD